VSHWMYPSVAQIEAASAVIFMALGAWFVGVLNIGCAIGKYPF